jgi:prevent-host-death family protein
MLAMTWLDLVMISVKIAELKDHLSKYLRAAERGETVEVLDRDRPIARIVPIVENAAVTIIPPRRSFSEVRNKRYPELSLGYDIVELLLEDRRKP